MKRDDITPEMIMARFLLVFQSNKDLKIENDLIISASIYSGYHYIGLKNSYCEKTAFLK